MTAPDRPYPSGAYGNRGTVAGLQQVDEAGAKTSMRAPIDALSGGAHGGLFGGLFNGFGSLLAAISGTVNNDYVAELDITRNQQREIKELKDAYRQMILQGEALMFTTPGTYYPSEGIVSIDLILIGGGGGGGGGKWDTQVGNRQGGSGGAGGGEITATIPAHLLPSSVPIIINEQGIGGGRESAGSVGGNVMFGSYLIAGGGQGGLGANGNDHITPAGGSGLIAGGAGGVGGYTPNPPGGWSNYPGELRGGGGGGGGGSFSGGIGGTGGASPGGLPGQNGTSPSEIIATGGGGGGSGWSNNLAGGHGGYPGGGGGGGFGGGFNQTGNGGNGARGKLIILERKF